MGVLNPRGAIVGGEVEFLHKAMADSLFIDETPPGSPYNPTDMVAPDNVDAELPSQLVSTLQSSYDAVSEACRARDEQLVPKLPLIPFVAEITRELLHQDHLAVTAKGLGLYQTAAALIMATDAAGTQRTVTSSAPVGKESLVLVIGASRDDFTHLQAELSLLALSDVPTRGMQSLRYETSASKRSDLYSAGGVYAVTTPILVVDMLTDAIPVNKITGIIVLHAERVDDTSNEAFILRLLRSKNPHAFIKALSDNPGRISPGINGLSMRLRSLQVSKVALWPRFHVQVSDCLGNATINECIIDMSESMRLMQAQVAELLQGCISDIKRRVPSVDTESWTVDAAMRTDLERTVRTSLSSQWHRLSRDGRRSVDDLGVLQYLLSSITRQHPVQLLRELEQLWYARPTDMRDVSPWLLTAPAEALRELVRQRVLVHEGLPKLEYLRSILEGLETTSRVLIVVEDMETVLLVRHFLEQGFDYTRREQDFLNWRTKLQKAEEAAGAKEPEEPVDDRRAKRRRVRGTSRTTEERPRETTPLTSSVSPSPDVEPVAFTPLKVHPLVVKHTDSQFLDELKPDTIIVYDLQMEFTRAIEMYRARTASDPSIYFLYYKNSIEEMRYLTALRQEKDAFTRLIQEKGAMPMVIIDEEEALGNEAPRVVSTRVGGRLQTRVLSEQPRVIVDAREFRSSLPFLVWQARMQVIPLTLLVGDYILTPDICVERKTVTDLIESFKSGRLANQCESMFRHYKIPVLLIEFGSDKSFSLEPFREIRTASLERQSSIHGNLALLLLKFPKLKLIWSASPRHTAEIFRSLKLNADEPDPVQSAQTGVQVVMNESARDMLEAIPGVTAQNSELIMAQVASLAELVEMDVDALAKIVGREPATKIVRFFRMGE